VKDMFHFSHQPAGWQVSRLT